MTIDHTRRRVVTLLCSLPFAPARAAATFPARTVRIVVPYGVGVGPDLVARAGTPQPLLDQLHRDVTAALGAAEVRARADTAGFELTPSTPQQLRERIAQDLALYRPLVAEGRISNA